jgi:hypothetical protein
MTDPITLFGIRHHGPGCAHSLRKALDTLRPDCVVVEGPAGCESLLPFIVEENMTPPVAMLSHSVEHPKRASFHPYAQFSPEWQAFVWAEASKVPVRLMDLPPQINLALLPSDELSAHEETPVCKDEDEPQEEALESTRQSEERIVDISEPLDFLASAAGYADGEAWWNHMVEERGDGEGLFEAIAQAMEALRHHTPRLARESSHRETIREAHMRTLIRKVRKEGFERIAVVCGAWHVPALKAKVSVAADRAVLKGLAKIKTQTTWVPWTYRHLSANSGYHAGIDSPGWYDHLWSVGVRDLQQRTIGWLAKVARIMREHELDCSSAHLIEASRLAEALAAMHERPQPSLEELNQATLSVICHGNEAPMQLIADALMIGERLGSVPSSVPTVPLHRDVTAQQKRLRLKPQASVRILDLDLRKDNDLQRSHMLHRLALLGIDWGILSKTGHSVRGTFHEIWELAWQPNHEIDLIIASQYGHTLVLAATTKTIETAQTTESLEVLTKQVSLVLLADLPKAVTELMRQLDRRAATDGNPLELLAALPPLANTYRYGNVRKTDAAQVEHIFDGIVLRASLALPLAVININEGAAESARSTLLSADRAIKLRDGELQYEQWHRALLMITSSDQTEPLIRGLATRLAWDVDAVSQEVVCQQLQRNMSIGEDPLHAARWLDGFLNRDATVLIHSDLIWPLIDTWLSELSETHFIRILPLVRRSFTDFEVADRRDLGVRVTQATRKDKSQHAPFDWHPSRAQQVVPTLCELFGLRHEQ